MPTSSWDALSAVLNESEIQPLRELVNRAPVDSSIASWLPIRQLVWAALKLDGQLAGWLIAPVADPAEAPIVGEALAAILEQTYGPMRASRSASIAAIKRAAH